MKKALLGFLLELLAKAHPHYVVALCSDHKIRDSEVGLCFKLCCEGRLAYIKQEHLLLKHQ